MSVKSEKKYNSIIVKYPTHRDNLNRGCWKYMEGRRCDDNAEGLWRVHDKIYDLNSFIDRHPGGKQWLILTKGTDVTEAFETHHLTSKASEVLQKFFVRNASEQRNYKLTFDEDGFYKTLKRRVVKRLQNVDVKKDLWKSKLILDFNLLALFVSVYFAASTRGYSSVIWTLLSGQFMAWTTNFSHNFMHQKDNWRMYTSNLSFVNWRDFRVFHVMSHHLYTNSYSDLEVSNFERHLIWIPYKVKSKIDVLYSYLITPFSWASIFFVAFFQRYLGTIYSKTKVWYWDEIIILSVPLVMLIGASQPITIVSFFYTYLHWWSIIALGSFLYALFAINNGHHAPEIVHEGDEFASLDFGIYQIGAIVDREEIDDGLFKVLAYFGLHTLHHLFPTLDHAVLPCLEDIYMDTCKEFSIGIKKTNLKKAMVDQFKQLARNEVKMLA